MHVCHVALGDLWGGAEAQIATLLPCLIRNNAFKISVVLFNPGRLADELTQQGVHVVVFDERSQGSLTLLKNLVRYFRNESCDIIHTHKPKDTVLCGLAKLFCQRSILVRTVHGAPEPFKGWDRVKMNFYEMLSKLVNKYMAAKIIAVSRDIRHAVSYVKDVKISYIPNGIDLGRVRPYGRRDVLRKEFGILDNDTVIGVVGRLTPVKGHRTFLESATSIASRDNHGLKFLIVGEGPSEVSLRQMAIDLGIDERVIFIGHRNDVYDVIEAIDIFVLPSYHEGIPMVLLEAMALKRAVIASRVGGIPEVIDHAIDGLLVPPASVKDLTDACNLLMRDEPLAASLKEAARAKVQACFSSSEMCREVASVYDHVTR